MSTPTMIAAYIALFVLTGFLFLFANLMLGWLVRPRLPNEEKLEVYECGEPTIGSSFVQFDLRFYVVALLFIIFDVEVAFFFPWGAVFGKATQLSTAPANAPFVAARLDELGLNPEAVTKTIKAGDIGHSATLLARTTMVDILAFFVVLLVGFAYVWRRGDLDWVRTVSHEKVAPAHRPPTPRAVESSQSILSA